MKTIEISELKLINEFLAWFRQTHRALGSAFEREVFFNSKDRLWEEWKKADEKFYR